MGKSSPVTRLLAAVLAVALLAACAPVPQLTTEQKLADFDFLFETFRDNHPFLFLKSRVERYDWLAHEAEFREAVRQTKDNVEFSEAVRRIVSLVGNAHTTVVGGWFVSLVEDIPGPWSEAAAQTTARIADYWQRLGVPGPGVLQAVHSGGEYYVCKTTIQGLANGARLVAIDGVTIHDYVVSLRGTTYLSWDPLRRQLYARWLSLSPGQQKTVTVEYSTGETDTFPVQGENITGMPYFSLPKYGQIVLTRTLAGGKVGYVHVSSMTCDDAHKAALQDYFAQIRDLPALIIDIRGNGGGSDRFWMEYIVGQLAAEPISASLGMAYRSAELVQSYVRASRGGEPSWVSGEDLAARDPRARVNLPPELLTDEFRGILPHGVTVSPDPDSVRYQGKVFLLVDDVVYSAAESFAAFAKASGWATLVGSCTGGDGIGSSVALVVLPNSGMALSFPPAMGLNPDWTANEETHTMPHVLVELSYEDVLKWWYRTRLGQIPKEPDPEIDTALRECLRLALEGR